MCTRAILLPRSALTKRQRINLKSNIVLSDTRSVLWPNVENRNSGILRSFKSLRFGNLAGRRDERLAGHRPVPWLPESRRSRRTWTRPPRKWREEGVNYLDYDVSLHLGYYCVCMGSRQESAR